MWSLTVPTAVTVYLDFWGGDDHLEKGVKDWLLSTSSQWVRSSQITGSSFSPSYGPGHVYMKNFPAGQIDIYGNGGQGHGTFYRPGPLRAFKRP